MNEEQEWRAKYARICVKNGEIAEALQLYSTVIHPNWNELKELQKHPDYNKNE